MQAAGTLLLIVLALAYIASADEWYKERGPEIKRAPFSFCTDNLLKVIDGGLVFIIR